MQLGCKVTNFPGLIPHFSPEKKLILVKIKIGQASVQMKHLLDGYGDG